jgi:hypothetical protein
MTPGKSLRELKWAMRQRIILFVGWLRVQIEGEDSAELSHPRWDRIVGWLEP